jgi:hypothetical protein
MEILKKGVTTMATGNFYKLLPNEDGDGYDPLTPEQSYKRAIGSRYESWFDTLKASPWYKAMWDGHPVFDDPTPGVDGINRAVKTMERFGDLRKVNFKEWWFSTGHRIFAEHVPYVPVQAISVKLKNVRRSLRRGANERPVQSMLIEIPLNLKPSAIRSQINEILNDIEHFRSNFNPWVHSTADAPFSRNSKLDHLQVTNWLKVFKHWEENKSKKEPRYQLYDLCVDMQLTPELGFEDTESFEFEPIRVRHERMTAVAEYALKNARNLMANAIFMDFPNTTQHELATNYSAPALKRAVRLANKPPSHDFNKARQRKKEAAKRLKDAG